MAAALHLDINLNPTLDVAKFNALLAKFKQALGQFGDGINLIDPNEIEEIEAASVAMNDLGEQVDEVDEKGKSGNANFLNLSGMLDVVERASQALGQLSNLSLDYEQSLANVGAITGQTGESLQGLGKDARDLAVEFGTKATDQLESYQGILSKLGPGMAESAEGMKLLARNVNVLSASGAGTAKESMNALTDSMLQFGLVSGDAEKDAETSTLVINALAAGAQVGAAEIPEVTAAILQSGVAAKGANQSFESMNAAIQVLAVGGKKGSEAGVGLRNVLALMQKASGPAELAMSKLGTSSKELGEVLTTQGLDAALAKINEGMGNVGTAAERNKILFEIFGAENAATAGILLDNTAKLKEFEAAIRAGQEGTGSAFEQAAQRMDTAQGTIDRARAYMEEQLLKITDLVGTGVAAVLGSAAEIAPAVSSLASITQLFPAGAGKGLKNFAASILTTLLPALVASETGFFGVELAATTSWAAILAPVTIILGVLALISGAVYVLYENFDEVRHMIDDLWDKIKGFASGVVGALGALFTGDFGGIADAFSDGFNESVSSSLKESMEETLAELDVEAKVKAQGDFDDLLSEYEDVQNQIKTLSSKSELTQADQEQLDQLKAKAKSAAGEIAKIAPETKANITTEVDAAGNLVDVYDINIDKARELSEQNKEIFSEDLADAQERFSEKATELADIYSEQKERLAEVKQELDEANADGDKEEARELKAEYAALNAEITKNKSALVDTFTSGSEAGVLTKDATDDIKEALELTEEQATELLEIQEKQTEEAKATAAAVEEIGESFEDTFQKANEAVDATLAELNTLQLRKRELEQSGEVDTSALESIDAQIAATEELLIQQDKERDSLKDILDANKALIEEPKKKTQKVDSEFAVLQRQFDLQKQIEDQDLARNEIIAERVRIEEGREANSQDELVAERAKLTLLKSQYDTLVKTMELEIDEDGNIINIGVGIKKDEKVELAQTVRDLALEIESQTTVVVGVQSEVSIETKELEKLESDLQRKTLEMRIELGIASTAELLPIVTADLEAVTDERKRIEEELAKELSDAQKIELRRQLVEISDTEISLRKEVVKTTRTVYQERLSDMQSIHEQEQNDLTTHLETMRTTTESTLLVAHESRMQVLSSTHEKELAELEDKREDDLISETKYLERKLELEEEFRAQQTIYEGEQEGAQLAIDQEEEVANLLAAKQKLEDELSLALEFGQDDAAEELRNQLDAIAGVIDEKSSTIGASMDVLKTGVASSLSSLFAGDTDSAKEGMRKTFAQLAGYLKKLITAAALEIVLASQPIKALAAAAGPLAPVVLAGVTATVSAGINALASPIISGILSFSTGGIVDEPTLAVVGDRSLSTGADNTEFILGSDQLQAIISQSYGTFAAPVVNELKLVREALEGMQLQAVVNGEDVYLLVKQQEHLANDRFVGQ